MNNNLDEGITEFGMDSDEQFYIELDETKTVVIRDDQEETTIEAFENGSAVAKEKTNRIYNFIKNVT